MTACEALSRARCRTATAQTCARPSSASCLLKLDGGAKRIDGAGKLDQRSVARQLDQPPAVASQYGLQTLLTVFSQARQRARSRRAPSGGSSRQRLRRGSPPVCAAHGPWGFLLFSEDRRKLGRARQSSRRAGPGSATLNGCILDGAQSYASTGACSVRRSGTMPSRRRFIALSSAAAVLQGWPPYRPQAKPTS